MKASVLDFRPTRSLFSAPASVGNPRERKARAAAERVLYETHQRMGSIRDALSGHGPGGFPEPGELLRVLTYANITSLAFVLRAVEVFGALDLTVSVYTMNQRAVYVIRELVADGRLRSTTILGSDTLCHRDPARIREMHETAAEFPDRVRYGLADTHAKVMCFAGEVDGARHQIVISGSANLTSNARIEDYLLTNSAEGYAHHVGWITELVHAGPLPDPRRRSPETRPRAMREPTEYIEALRESGGIHWRAAEKLGCPREEVVAACAAHPEVEAARLAAEAVADDLVKDRLLGLVSAGNLDAIKQWQRIREGAKPKAPRRRRTP